MSTGQLPHELHVHVETLGSEWPRPEVIIHQTAHAGRLLGALTEPNVIVKTLHGPADKVKTVIAVSFIEQANRPVFSRLAAATSMTTWNVPYAEHIIVMPPTQLIPAALRDSTLPRPEEINRCTRRLPNPNPTTLWDERC